MTWVTASTMQPTVLSWMLTTMVRVSSSTSRGGRPNRLRRLTIGMTEPRRLISPSMKSGTWGIRVIGFIKMISWILVMAIA